MLRMAFKHRINIAWKVLFGNLLATKMYFNPKYGVTEVTLLDKRVDW